MKPGYVIRLSDPKSKRVLGTKLWDGHTPTPLGHPFHFVLERVGESVRIRDISQPLGQILRKAANDADFSKSGRAEIDTDDLSLTVDELPNLNSIFSIPQSAALKGDALSLITSLGPWVSSVETGLNKFSNLHFQARTTDGGLEIQAKSDLELRVDGGRKKTLQKGEKAIIDLATSIGFENWVYRFRLSQTPQINSKQRLNVSGYEIGEARALKNSFIGSGLAILALFLIAVLWPKAKIEEELVPPQFASIVLAKPQEATNSAPKSAPQPQAKAEETATVQAFKTQAVQTSMSSLLKGGMTKLLAQSDLVANRRASKAADAIFGQRSQTMTGKITNDKLNNKNVEVAALDGAQGQTYSKGKRAGVTGQGSMLVDLDTSLSTVESGLTKDEVGRVIHSHMSEVRYCYESAMIRTPDLEGKLVIDFVISGAGSVKRASVKQSNLGDPRLDDCIMRRLSSWKFPNPKGGIDVGVSYPFIFKTLAR